LRNDDSYILELFNQVKSKENKVSLRNLRFIVYSLSNLHLEWMTSAKNVKHDEQKKEKSSKDFSNKGNETLSKNE
jgi:hypothetical protein